jgi:hypothetical protein
MIYEVVEPTVRGDLFVHNNQWLRRSIQFNQPMPSVEWMWKLVSNKPVEWIHQQLEFNWIEIELIGGNYMSLPWTRFWDMDSHNSRSSWCCWTLRQRSSLTATMGFLEQIRPARDHDLNVWVIPMVLASNRFRRGTTMSPAAENSRSQSADIGIAVRTSRDILERVGKGDLGESWKGHSLTPPVLYRVNLDNYIRLIIVIILLIENWVRTI